MKTADVQQLHRLNPKNDFLFKRLFGEKEGKRLLIGLLNAILRREGAQMITDVSILEDTKLARELVEDKEAVLDILCEVDGREKSKCRNASAPLCPNGLYSMSASC